MTDNELLLAISDIIDKKIQPLESDIKSVKRDLQAIKVDLIENTVVPRLSNIEQHYVTTADRYVNDSDKIESMQTDIDIMKKVLKEHTERLNNIA